MPDSPKPLYEQRQNLEALLSIRCEGRRKEAEAAEDSFFYPGVDAFDRPIAPDQPVFWLSQSKTAIEITENAESEFFVALRNPNPREDFPQFDLEEWIDEQTDADFPPVILHDIMLRVSSLGVTLEFKFGDQVHAGFKPSIRGLAKLEGILDGAQLQPAPVTEPHQPPRDP